MSSPESPTRSLSRRQKKQRATLEKEQDIQQDRALIQKARLQQKRLGSQLKSHTTSFPSWTWHMLGALIILGFILFLKSGEDVYRDLDFRSQPTNEDFYSVLSLKPSATTKEVKDVYRKLSLTWHPDKQGERGCDQDCYRRFEKLNKAYKILVDPERRRVYDTTKRIITETIRTPTFYSFNDEFETVLTKEVWHKWIKPSLAGYGLTLPHNLSDIWAFLIIDPTAPNPNQMFDLWKEIAVALHGRISFIRVDARDAQVMSLIGLKFSVLPAIVVMRPGDTPLTYNRIKTINLTHLLQWLQNTLPNSFKSVDSNKANELFRGDFSGTNSDLIPIILASDQQPSSILQSTAFKYRSIFEFFWTKPPQHRYRSKFVSPSKNLSVSREFIIPLELLHKRTDLETDARKLMEIQTESLIPYLESVMRVRKFMALTDIRLYQNKTVTLFDENFQYLCNDQHQNETLICVIDSAPSTLSTKESFKLPSDIQANIIQHVSICGVNVHQVLSAQLLYPSQRLDARYTALGSQYLKNMSSLAIKSISSELYILKSTSWIPTGLAVQSRNLAPHLTLSYFQLLRLVLSYYKSPMIFLGLFAGLLFFTNARPYWWRPSHTLKASSD